MDGITKHAIIWHRHLAGCGPASERWAAQPKPHFARSFNYNIQEISCDPRLNVTMEIQS